MNLLRFMKHIIQFMRVLFKQLHPFWGFLVVLSMYRSFLYVVFKVSAFKLLEHAEDVSTRNVFHYFAQS